MAIIYTTGTENQPDAGSVGLSMVEQIRDDLVAHPAWELVEEFTPGGSPICWYVFKCLASESGLVADYHVVIGRGLGDGRLRFYICEGYTAGTHLMQGNAPAVYHLQIAYDALGRWTVDKTLSTAWPTDLAYGEWLPSGTSTKWWLATAEDGFTVAFNGPSNGFIQIGSYIPLTVMAIALPICIYSSTNSGYNAITRNPAVADSPSYYSAALLWNPHGIGFGGDMRYNDKIQGNNRPVIEYGMVLFSYQTGDQASHGWVLGKLKHMRAGGQYPAGIAFGDAYVLDGRLWVPYNPQDSRIWDTGVAAS